MELVIVDHPTLRFCLEHFRHCPIILFVSHIDHVTAYFVVFVLPDRNSEKPNTTLVYWHKVTKCHETYHILDAQHASLFVVATVNTAVGIVNECTALRNHFYHRGPKHRRIRKIPCLLQTKTMDRFCFCFVTFVSSESEHTDSEAGRGPIPIHPSINEQNQPSQQPPTASKHGWPHLP